MNRRKLKIKERRLILSALLIFILLFLVVYQAAGLVRLLLFNYTIKVNVINHGTLMETIPASGLLIKEEIMLQAPIKGNVKILVKEGERISKGAVVAKVTALSLDSSGGTAEKLITVPRAGWFCTHVDGLEDVLSPETVLRLDFGQISTLTQEIPPYSGQQEQVDAGQVVAKLVDNLCPMLIYLEVPKGKLRPLGLGSEYKLKYKSVFLEAELVKEKVQGKKQLLLLSTRDCPEDMIHKRKIDLEIINKELSGFIVPVDALINKKNKTGMYIDHRQRVRWVPVEVKGVVGDKAVVISSNLLTGTHYIANPQTLIEDDNIH